MDKEEQEKEQLAELLKYGRCTGSHCNRRGIAQEPHLCPFSEEIYNNQSKCNCCNICIGECANDI